MSSVSNVHIKTDKIVFTGALSAGIASGTLTANQENCLSNNDGEISDINKIEEMTRKSNSFNDMSANGSENEKTFRKGLANFNHRTDARELRYPTDYNFQNLSHREYPARIRRTPNFREIFNHREYSAENSRFP